MIQKRKIVMKNLLKLAFAFAFVLSMTACRGESKTEDYEFNDPQQKIQQDGENLEDDPVEIPEEPEISEAPAEPTEPEEPTSEPEAPAEDLTNEEAPFDTSWASNEFELQIAEPAFESWSVSEFAEGSSLKISK